MKKYFTLSKKDNLNRIGFIKDSIAKSINDQKEGDLIKMIYSYNNTQNLKNILKPTKSFILKIIKVFSIVIIVLIPSNFYPIINKFFSKKNQRYNNARNKIKFLLQGSPKKYILKNYLFNLRKILSDAE